MSIFTFGSSEKTLSDCERVRVAMDTLDGGMVLHLLAVPVICEPLAAQPLALCLESYEHLSNLELADSTSDNSAMEIDLLVGSDYYWELATGRICCGNDGPIAVETKLGWVLSGPVPAVESSCSLLTAHTLKVDSREERSLDDALRAFWELESLGICGANQSVHQEFEQNISFKDGRYEVGLPWRKPRPILPDNHELSQKRLHSLLRRLRQSPAILQEYDAVIRKQVELGIVQQVPDSDFGIVGSVHYLPHHAVVKQEKETTKVRVVYDASARAGGPSLNECLFAGPNFNQKILDILLRFRSYPVALVSDIEKAFLMVSISEEDRDVLRFLWIDDATKADPAVQVFRFTRVVFGVSSSPFLLNATIDHHLKLFSSTKSELVRLLLQSIYVDDVVAGARDVDAALQLYRDSKGILREGGFNLRKFVTNEPQLQRAINELEGVPCSPDTDYVDETTYAKSTLGGVQEMSPTDQKVLGVRWDVSTDCLVFSVQEMTDLEEPTKRKIESTVGKFYDPLGFFHP